MARPTALAYDLADHLKSIDGPSEPVVSFSIDALGRSKSRQVGAGTAETLNYAGTSDAIVRIGGGSTPVDAALDPAGTRLATRQSAGSPSFLLPDPHGNVAAIWSGATSAWGDVFRYDPWGETIAAYTTGASRTPWRFQGRMVEGEPGDAELYDFGFRSYAADTGAFASLDDVAGGAHDVRSLNRFLYAHADPVTLIDPDGHAPQEGSNNHETMSDAVIKHQQQAAAQTAKAKARHAQAKSSSADAGHAKKAYNEVNASWQPPAFDIWMSLGDHWRDWYIAQHGEDAMAWEGWGDNDQSVIAYWIVSSRVAGLVDEVIPIEMIVSLERVMAFRDALTESPDGTDETWGASLALVGIGSFKPVTGGQYIYRGGGKNPGNFKIRPGEDSVSFRDSLSNPLEPGKPVLHLGKEYVVVDPARLPAGSVVYDGVPGSAERPPGHVSVYVDDPWTIKGAVIFSDEFDK